MNERTCELWIISNGSKIAVKNMTREDAIAVYDEFVRQYRNEGWMPINTRRAPQYLTKLHKGTELVTVGMIDHATPQPPAFAWLARVPEMVRVS